MSTTHSSFICISTALAVFTLSYMYGVHVRRTCAINVYTVAHVRRACATNRYTSDMHDVHVRRTCMIV